MRNMRNSLDYAGLAQLCARSPIMRKIMRAHNRIIQPSLVLGLCVCVCLSVCKRIFKAMCLVFTTNFFYACYLCSGSVLWWCCNTLFTSGFMDDVMFAHNGRGDMNRHQLMSKLCSGKLHQFDTMAFTQSDPPRAESDWCQSLISTITCCSVRIGENICRMRTCRFFCGNCRV